MTLRLAGTNTSGSVTYPYFQPEGNNTQAACVQGATHTGQWPIRLHAGAMPATYPSFFRLAEYAAGGGSILAASDKNVSPTSASLSAQIHFHTRTATAATCAAMTFTLIIPIAVGEEVDMTLMFGPPQQAPESAPSSIILPPVATPGVTIRTGDTVFSNASLIADLNNWAILTEFVLTGAAGNEYPSSFSMSTPDNARRFTANTNANSRNRGFSQIGGTGGTISLGTYADGVPRKEIIGVTGGTVRGSFNGSAVVSAAYTLDTSGISRLFLGSITDSGGNSLNGIIRRQTLFRACPSDAAMQALST